MSTITVPRGITTDDVTEALRAGLDPRYEVQPGMRMPRSPLLGKPQPDRPELILVSASPMIRAQVKITRRPDQTDIKVTPAGLLGDLLLNTFVIAPKIRQVLRSAPSLR
ncbi:MAG TPA: hypothetical protein VGL69_11755 [Solirubrobacteraceae bacterium]|jgi:hypothetical protein